MPCSKYKSKKQKKQKPDWAWFEIDWSLDKKIKDLEAKIESNTN